MGVNPSKHAITPVQGETTESVRDEPDSDSGPRCFSLFCPPNGRPRSGSLSSLGSSFRGGSKDPIKSRKSQADKFGTPIMDTPDRARRIRFEEEQQQGDYDNAEEEKKSASSDGGMGSKRSSKYPGMEKEGSQQYADEDEMHQNRKLHQQYQGARQGGEAEIHEGKNAETELYAKYELLEVLGVGSTSTCHRCVERTSGDSRACKIIDMTEVEPQYRSMLEQFMTEIRTLRSLRHPNIIKLYDVYVSTERIYIVMELMHGGELFDYVVQKGTLTEEEASRIVRMVTAAVVYMHSKNIIHRDLKPENLLLQHKPRSSHDVEVKIIDFGLSKIVVDETMAKSFLGTRGYLAPEMLQRQGYSKSVDAWALGVIVFVLLCGCLPFDDDCREINSHDARTKFALRFPRWARDLSESAKDLLSRLLDVDPRRRYTAEQALQHPWVQGATASNESLLQSPGRITMGGKQLAGGNKSAAGTASQETKDHVSQMVANRAIANAQRAAGKSPRVVHHVRKISI